MSNNTANTSTPSSTTSPLPQPEFTAIKFKKQITIYVDQDLTFGNFKKYYLKRNRGEDDVDFHTRALAVWDKMLDETRDTGCYFEKDYGEKEVDDDNYDCEDEIEQFIEEAVEREGHC